jgi:hypothetical protein
MSHSNSLLTTLDGHPVRVTESPARNGPLAQATVAPPAPRTRGAGRTYVRPFIRAPKAREVAASERREVAVKDHSAAA